VPLFRAKDTKGDPPLVSIPVGGAFERIGMDFIELEGSRDGNKYALVLQDYLTKSQKFMLYPTGRPRQWPGVYWMLCGSMGFRHDHAAEFLSKVVQEVVTLLGVSRLPHLVVIRRLTDLSNILIAKGWT